MDTTAKQEITIHQALHQPILVMGGERKLVAFLAVIAGVFIISLAQLWAAVFGVLLWVFGQWGLAQLAKFDPLFSKTGLRHMKYKKYYPASATPFAPNRSIQ